MNRIIICLVFFSSIIKIQAQDLTIKGDNFIYVDNTVLYVNKGIDLQTKQRKKVDDDSTVGGSNIYLRGGAQLIQEDNNNSNSGEGNVSIIVAGSANKWSYNYFGSPVSAPDNYKGSNNSDATDGQYYVSQIDEPLLSDPDDNDKPIRLKSINSRDAEFTANWDSEQNPMVISSRYLFKLEEPGNWVRIDPERDGDMSNEVSITTGNGFAMKGLGDHDNHTKLNPYDFRGKPNNGTIEVNVKRQDDHLVLIGNPYPSILDIRKFYADNAGKIESFRFWEAGSDKSHYFTESEGGYATMTIFENIITPGKAKIKKFNNNGEQIDGEGGQNKEGQKSMRPFIPVGQGFIVELTKDTDNPNTKLVFNNSQRVYKNRINKKGKGEGDDQNGTSDFFRPGKDVKDDENTSIPSQFMRFRMNIGFNENTIRPLVMTFHDRATKGFDLGLEAGPMSVGSYDGLWGNKNDNYIFQAFKYEDDLTIPLYIKLKSQSFVEFNSYDYTNIPDDMEILMHDLYTDLYYDLREQNFSITLPAGDHENRFEIAFQENSKLNQSDFNANLFKIVSDNSNKKLLVYNPKLKSLKSIKLYDTSGKEVYNLTVNKTSSIFEISTYNISNGVFIAQIESTENTSCSKRVIINK